MKPDTHPLGETPPEAVFILLDGGEDPRRRGELAGWMQRVLPLLNWRSHLYLLGRERAPGIEIQERIADLAVSFLHEQGLASIHLHPVFDLDRVDAGRRRGWQRLLAPSEPFQAHAYQDQAEMRLPVLPLLVCSPEVPEDDVAAAADFFVERAARPSFYLAREPGPELASRADAEGIRLYVDCREDAEAEPRNRRLIDQLQINHVFDSLLPRIEDDASNMLAPCAPRLVVDVAGGRAFTCFEHWRQGRDGVPFGSGTPDSLPPPAALSPAQCRACIGRSLLCMRANIEANRRRNEGGRLLFRAGQDLSAKGEHRLAAEMSGHAVELCDADRDRGAALIQQGLCRLALGEYARAEDALGKADAYPVDRGLVAYYRGRVQFDWRDYIEALDRFGEALSLGCAQAPREDICFQMALCHINIEEYAEARPFLEQSLMPGEEKAPVSFYRGICDLGQGNATAALRHFREALRIGPSDEDLGRVIFYVGSCLKELERFDEAIEALEQAVRIDPDDLANHNLLGFCYYKTRQHEKAVNCFRRAVEIDPGSGIDWANLGSNLRDLGKIDEAVAMYRKALSLDPTLAFARENLERLTGDVPSP